MCFVGAKYCYLFYDCNSFGNLGEVFALGGEVPLSFLVVVGLRHGVEYNSWPVTVAYYLVKSQAGCSFGLNYDSYVTLRAIGQL